MYKYFFLICFLFPLLVSINGDTIWKIRKEYKNKPYDEILKIAVDKTHECQKLTNEKKRLTAKVIRLRSELAFYRSRRAMFIVLAVIAIIVLAGIIVFYIFMKR